MNRGVRTANLSIMRSDSISFYFYLRDFRLPPRSRWDQRSSGLLHSE